MNEPAGSFVRRREQGEGVAVLSQRTHGMGPAATARHGQCRGSTEKIEREGMSMPRFTRSTSFPRVDAGAGALMGDGFVSDAMLEEWIRAGVATRSGAIMSLSDGRRYALTDGLRILGRRNGDSDPYGLTGCLITLRSLLRR